MKTITTLFLYIIISLSFIKTTTLSQISWIHDWEDAKEKAIKTNKLILADFTADWCMPCLKMEKEVWNQPKLSLLESKLIYTKVDFDNNIPMNNKYDIDAIPAILIFDGFGTKLFHFIGYQTEDFIVNLIKFLPHDVSDMNVIKEKLIKEPNNSSLQIDLADIYREYGMYEISNDCYESVLDLEQIQDDSQMVDKILTFKAVNYLFLNDPDEASELFEDCITEFPNSKYRPLQLFGKVKANIMIEDEEVVREYYEMLKKEFSNDKHTVWAKNLFNE